MLIEIRGAKGKQERLPELATELVRLRVDILVTPGTLSTLAAKHATTALPIVMVGVGDPVGTGFAASLARPGGNITGLQNGSCPRGPLEVRAKYPLTAFHRRSPMGPPGASYDVPTAQQKRGALHPVVMSGTAD
jgi:hypothetical protein